MNSIIKSKKTYYILGILFLFFVWFIASIIVDNEGILPKISTVFNDIVKVLVETKTYQILGNTVLKIFITIIVSLLIALVLSILSLIDERIENFIRPSIVVMKSIPIVAIVMILLSLFLKQNVRYIGTMIASGFVIIPILYESILVGFKTIDSWTIKATKLFSKLNFHVIRKIYIPLALPNIISGLLSSFGLGLKVLVMSEVIMNPNDSIGQLIGLYSSLGELSMIFAWSILLLVIVVIIDYLIKVWNKKLN